VTIKLAWLSVSTYYINIRDRFITPTVYKLPCSVFAIASLDFNDDTSDDDDDNDDDNNNDEYGDDDDRWMNNSLRSTQPGHPTKAIGAISRPTGDNYSHRQTENSEKCWITDLVGQAAVQRWM